MTWLLKIYIRYIKIYNTRQGADNNDFQVIHYSGCILAIISLIEISKH